MRTFEGIKVVDFTQVIAGPFATYQLALQGAEVIKIETPVVGDQGRRIYQLDDTFAANGYSAIFLSANAGKRSITLDLKHPEAKDVIYRMVRNADVVVENFKAGTLDRLGFGWNDLKKINSKIIYCSITGFGQTGPRANAAAYDPTIQAASGLLAINGSQETGPMRVGPIVCDIAASTTAAFAIAGMLYKRERTGEGAYIDLSMQDVGVTITSPSLLQTEYGFEPKLMGSRSLSGDPMSGIFMTKNGNLLLMPATDAQRNKVWAIIGREELIEDTNFVTLEARLKNELHCLEAIKDGLLAQEAKVWEQKFSDAGVPAAAVLTLPEVLEDHQLAHRNTKRSTTSPVDGRDLFYFDTPFKISDEETGADCPPPLIGADTTAVLAEIGYNSDEISSLREAGVI